MKASAGILLFRKTPLEFFLVHPGGPFWKNKDEGAWSIPKGEIEDDEDPLGRAATEFMEETGSTVSGNFIPLQPVRQKSGKLVHAWALEGDIDETRITSNQILITWPPRTDRHLLVPEIDKGDWFDTKTALLKINPAQRAFIHELTQLRSGDHMNN